jgi:hypothetical protein
MCVSLPAPCIKLPAFADSRYQKRWYKFNDYYWPRGKLTTEDTEGTEGKADMEDQHLGTRRSVRLAVCFAVVNNRVLLRLNLARSRMRTTHDPDRPPV